LPRHEHFEELAAIGAKGELTPSEQQQLDRHLAGCAQCRQISEEYENLHAPLRPPTDPKMEALIESRREKVKAAVLQAISNPQLQPQVHTRLAAPSPTVAERWTALRLVWVSSATAAALALVFWLGVRYQQHEVSAAEQTRNLTTDTVQNVNRVTAPGLRSDAQEQTDASQYMQLQSDLRAAKQRGVRLDTSLTGKDRELAESENARLLLQQQLDSQSEQLRSTQTHLIAKTDEFNQVKAAKASDSTTLVALQYQVQDLKEKLTDQTQSLDRERQLLANGRDIRDIIGARNLHIIDVYDTDGEGNTRKSFARAFYTEGKSLIFYAYDLPARGTEDGKYVYAAWGEKNGNKNRVQKLGILLNDDKGQKRWALNFSNPKVLAEIDSVFVTLERVGRDGTEPKGKRMLTAYLDSQVNHP
jgi:hypothetical protein